MIWKTTLKNKYIQNSRGFLYYAYNNDVINYLKLAICSALTGRYQLPSFRAMVVTNSDSLESLSDEEMSLLYELFEKIKIDDEQPTHENYRVVIDGDERRGIHLWLNGTRPNAYADSIYDETIMIDVDFLIQDNNLDKLWGSQMPIMMNRYVVPVINKEHASNSGFIPTENIGNFTVPMYWATIVYYNRSEFSEYFFNLVNHIKDNYFYFQRLYQASDKAYRNDHSFSIALYIANGNRMPGTEWEIPYKFVLSTAKDTIYRIDKGQIKLIVNTRDWKSPKHLFNIQKMSLHCMNKVNLMHNYKSMIEVYTNE